MVTSYISCIKYLTSVIAFYYIYNKMTNLGENLENIKIKVEEYKKNKNTLNFNYVYCKPVLITCELSFLLGIENQLCNFYELITIINNYLYDNNLIQLQYTTLSSSLQKLLSTEESSMPYYKFIENLLDKHVQEYIHQN